MKKSLPEILAGLTYLPNRTPDMAFTGGADDAFSEVAIYRDGAIYVGFYSGSSEWERHSSGDEIVICLEGSTTLVLLKNNGEEQVPLCPQELAVVPANTWHRFENSMELKVMTVTPQPTDHMLERPDA